MQIPVLLEKSPHQKGNNQREVPNFIAKLPPVPKVQEELHQQHEHCLTDCITVSDDWGNVQCLQPHFLTQWLDVLSKLQKTRGDSYQ